MSTHLETLLASRLTPIAADLDARDLPPSLETVVVTCGDWSLELTAIHYLALPPPPGGWEAPTPADTPPIPADTPRLREVEANALDAASADWLTGAQLAARAGYAANSYFRGAVGALVASGRLERAGRLVRLASGDSQREPTADAGGG